MSLIHEVVCWDFDMPGMKKLVLLYLSRSAHRHSQEARIHVSKVALDCGVSESTVRKAYDELTAEGYLMTLSKPRGFVHYRLTIDGKAVP